MPNQYLAPTITIPSALEITAITQAYPMVVTLSANSDQVNTYIIGQLVRLNVPYSYGMYQANGLIGLILANTGATISLNLNSIGFDPFIIPASTAVQPASLSPSGSRNLQFNNTTNQVGFQSLNNINN